MNHLYMQQYGRTSKNMLSEISQTQMNTHFMISFI